MISSFVGGNQPQTVMVNPATGQVLRTLPLLEAGTSAWWADGSRLVIVGWGPTPSGIYIMDAATGEVRQIGLGSVTDLHWLDADTIAFETLNGGL